MKERLVEDWLINVNERGFEIPFCQLLLTRGHKILRVGHTPYEDGKDIISLTQEGELHAYQLKGGDLGLADLERYEPQIEALVEAAVRHPSIKEGRRHKPFLVVTGGISDPVLHRVQNLNAAWKVRHFPGLTLIGRRELHADFVELSGDFWPVEPPKLRVFRSLYLATGEGDLDKPELAKFLLQLLAVPERTPKTQVVRRITAANIFTSYLLSEFYRTADHWSIFQGWTIAASLIAWAATAANLHKTRWIRPFELAEEAALSALSALKDEALKPRALAPHGFEIDDITRTRSTIVASAVATWHLIQMDKGLQPETLDRARSLVIELAQKGRLIIWGEGAVAHWLAIIWFLAKETATRLDETLLFAAIQTICKRNHFRSERPLADPLPRSR